MCPYGPEHVPPAIEYAVALRERRVNHIYLGLIAIRHEYRRGDARTLCLDKIQKELYCRLRAIG